MMRSAHKLHRNTQKAFSLIELIMTIVVVSIAVIPLSLLARQHMVSVFQSQDHTMALNLGRMEMEKVNNLPYNAIVNATIPNYAGYAYDMTRTVTYAQGSGLTPESLKQIRVDVRPAGGTNVLVSLTTYIARNVNYGL